MEADRSTKEERSLPFFIRMEALGAYGRRQGMGDKGKKDKEKRRKQKSKKRDKKAKGN